MDARRGEWDVYVAWDRATGRRTEPNPALVCPAHWGVLGIEYFDHYDAISGDECLGT